jgi:hypothetical protein
VINLVKFQTVEGDTVITDVAKLDAIVIEAGQTRARVWAGMRPYLVTLDVAQQVENAWHPPAATPSTAVTK